MCPSSHAVPCSNSSIHACCSCIKRLRSSAIYCQVVHSSSSQAFPCSNSRAQAWYSCTTRSRSSAIFRQGVRCSSPHCSSCSNSVIQAWRGGAGAPLFSPFSRTTTVTSSVLATTCRTNSPSPAAISGRHAPCWVWQTSWSVSSRYKSN